MFSILSDFAEQKQGEHFDALFTSSGMWLQRYSPICSNCAYNDALWPAAHDAARGVRISLQWPKNDKE